jgi:2-keto-4-pentenoate hydratase/2-oxohepta-3-ene-1,7-dioic acid hydratase in catechol pathway
VKLLTFAVGGRARYGAVVDGGVVDLSARLGRPYLDLGALIAYDGLASAAGAIARAPRDYTFDEITFLPPIPAPEKILCVGVNYANRNAEYRDGSDAPAYPSLFLRTPGSLVGHRQPILRPPESPQLDYEGELVIVIGKRGRRIPQDQALDYVAAVTCMNEGTIRDWVRHAKFNVTQGKNFASSGAIGPWIVTVDEFGGFDDVRVRTRVNGELRQDDTTGNMIFPIPYLVNYISTFAELKPGDVIATGTPVGAGARFDPPKWLVPGDVVEVEVEGVGTLVNPIADEPAQ